MYLRQQGQNNNKKKKTVLLYNQLQHFPNIKKKLKNTYISQIKVPTHFLDKNLVNKISIDKGYSITPQYLDVHSKITDNHMDFLFSKVQNSIPSRA